MTATLIITAFVLTMAYATFQTIRQYGDKAWSNFNG